MKSKVVYAKIGLDWQKIKLVFGGLMILLTGASGFVGSSILGMRDDLVIAPSLRGLSEDEIKRIIEESGADTVIHTAAISDIGVCSANPDASYKANVLLPIYIARASAGRKLICFSSDQVYSGSSFDGPYSEDMAKPGNIYAEHKLEMENRVLDILPSAVMLRAEWMYGYYHRKSNYLMNIINAKDKISFSSSQYRGITYIKEVAESMESVIRLPGGVYNFGSETTKSIYEITREFLSLIGKDIELCEAEPRHNLWMNCSKASDLGVKFSSVEDGLKRCAQDCKLI